MKTLLFHHLRNGSQKEKIRSEGNKKIITKALNIICQFYPLDRLYKGITITLVLILFAYSMKTKNNVISHMLI